MLETKSEIRRTSTLWLSEDLHSLPSRSFIERSTLINDRLSFVSRSQSSNEWLHVHGSRESFECAGAITSHLFFLQRSHTGSFFDHYKFLSLTLLIASLRAHICIYSIREIEHSCLISIRQRSFAQHLLLLLHFRLINTRSSSNTVRWGLAIKKRISELIISARLCLFIVGFYIFTVLLLCPGRRLSGWYKLFCWLICVMSRRYLWWHNGKSGTARAIKKEVFTSSIHNSSRMKRNNMKWMSWKSVKRAKSVISRKTRNSSATSYWILAWRFSSGFYVSHNILDWYHLSPTPWNNAAETISGAARMRECRPLAHTDHPRDDNNKL